MPCLYLFRPWQTLNKQLISSLSLRDPSNWEPSYRRETYSERWTAHVNYLILSYMMTSCHALYRDYLQRGQPNHSLEFPAHCKITHRLPLVSCQSMNPQRIFLPPCMQSERQLLAAWRLAHPHRPCMKLAHPHMPCMERAINPELHFETSLF